MGLTSNWFNQFSGSIKNKEQHIPAAPTSEAAPAANPELDAVTATAVADATDFYLN